MFCDYYIAQISSFISLVYPEPTLDLTTLRKTICISPAMVAAAAVDCFRRDSAKFMMEHRSNSPPPQATDTLKLLLKEIFVRAEDVYDKKRMDWFNGKVLELTSGGDVWDASEDVILRISEEEGDDLQRQNAEREREVGEQLTQKEKELRLLKDELR